jgi:prevent-host-death family protein
VEVDAMTILNATEARAKLYSLIDEAEETHEPIIITGRRGNAVLLSESDWNAITETLHLLSVPGMRESIREGLAENVKECSKELDW